MPTPTPEAWAQIRHAYEHTDTTIDQICAEHRISSGTLRDRMRRWGWTRRRSPIPPEGPPAVTMTQAVFSPPPVRPANGGEGSGGLGAAETAAHAHPTPLPIADAMRSDLPPPAEDQELAPADPATVVPRLQNAVAQLLPAIETVIRRLAASSNRPREMESAGRALSSLTRSLRELNGLMVQHQATVVAPGDAIPQDMDAFRAELARRLNAIIDRMQENAEEAKPEET